MQMLLPRIRLFHNPHYLRYWCALLVSNLGNWMQTAAMGWLVLQISGSAEALGWVLGVRFLPSLFLSLPAGVLADRYSRRQIVLLMQSLMMILAFLTAALVASDRLVYIHLLIISCVQGILGALDLPAREALVVELVSKPEYSEAVSLNALTFNLSRLVGPAVAGLCIAAWGISWAFLINALTFVPFVMTLILLPAFTGATGPTSAKNKSATGIREGLSYARTHPVARQLFFLLGWVSLFGLNFDTLIPAYANLELGLDATGYGFLMAALGFGALAGSVWQIVSPAARPGRGLRAALALACFHLLLGLPLNLGSVAAVWLGCGFSMVTLMINVDTSLQTLVPDHLRGRIMAIHSMVLLGSAPVGAWLSGFLFDHAGGRMAPALMGLLTLVGLLPFLRVSLPEEVGLLEEG
jgi:MFS family permease